MVKLLITLLLIAAGAVFYLNQAGFLGGYVKQFNSSFETPLAIKNDLDKIKAPLEILGEKARTAAENISSLSSPLKSLDKNSAATAPINIIDISQKVSTPPPLRIIKTVSESVLTKTGVISQTNTERTQNSLTALKESEKLNAAALVKGKDILEKQYFAHDSPSGVGADDLVKQTGYEYVIIGENLALGNFDSDRDVVNGWMNSPGHRANILNAKFTEIGVAVVKGLYEGRNVWVAVQEFGKPLSDCPEIDKVLKAQIEANENQLNQWVENLATMKTEMGSMNPRTAAYSQKVEEYNALVGQYNSLVKETQESVNKYNVQVNLFNLCVQTP